MDNDMVGRVARAILSGHNWANGDEAPLGFDGMTPEWQEAYRSMARSAIEEIGKIMSETALRKNYP